MVNMRLFIVACAAGALFLSGCSDVNRFFGASTLKTADDLQKETDAGRCADVAKADPTKIDLAGSPEGRPYYLVAFCKQIVGDDITKALEYYEIALAKGADPFWVYYNRGQLYLARSNMPKAREDLQKALELKPDNPDIPGLLVQAGGGNVAPAASTTTPAPTPASTSKTREAPASTPAVPPPVTAN